MKLFLSIALAAALAVPAFAQDQMDHSKMDNATMDHGDHDHAHDAEAEMPNPASELALVNDPEIVAALNAGGTPIVASVLGAVCDFCALAMNKTFSKQDEVSAVHVSLDDKTLNLVLKPGAEMDDETLTNLVKKAGYKVDKIDRNPALPTA